VSRVGKKKEAKQQGTKKKKNILSGGNNPGGELGELLKVEVGEENKILLAPSPRQDE